MGDNHEHARRAEEQKLRQLRTATERVCTLILLTDMPAVDIAIERQEARELCAELFPDRLDLYDLIYESRFDRLWEQFRDPEEGS
ncbi:MAG: hypothetical protein HYY96_04885 [Candidatus Tectomicrobia bacterium]|nr:hypothetical protein [Candidatus Tectomicrobia bacterium]